MGQFEKVAPGRGVVRNPPPLQALTQLLTLASSKTKLPHVSNAASTQHSVESAPMLYRASFRPGREIFLK